MLETEKWGSKVTMWFGDLEFRVERVAFQGFYALNNCQLFKTCE